MDKVTNEMLMAFVDGELDPATRKKIKAALHSDPELRARAAIFEATRQPIAEVFDPILSHPLSQLPKGMRTGAGKEGSAAHAPRDLHWRPEGLFRWFSGLFESSRTLSLAVALCAVFLGGLGIGLLMKTGLVPHDARGAALVAYRDDGLVATGSLDRTLETIGSGSRLAKSVTGGQELEIRPILTFRNRQGQFCREYEVLYPVPSRFAGLACRTEDGDWNVLVHSPVTAQPAPGNDTAVASGGGLETIDAVVGRIIKGNALDPEQETSLMNKGWRGQD